MEIVSLIKESLGEVINSLYKVKIEEIGLEHPQNPLWGDYSSNIAMVSARKLGSSPAALSGEIAKNLQHLLTTGLFESIEVAGPGFINFRLSRKFYLAQMLKPLKELDSFGNQDIGKGTRVALEHSNVNPNKAAHIGHLRNAVIGQFLDRAYKALGYDVKVQYYANDLGVQVSTSLLGMKRYGENYDTSKYKKFDHYAWEIYSRITEELLLDDELKHELEDMMAGLESGDQLISKEQFNLSQKVLKDNITTFAALNIDYDLIVYESSVKDMSMWEKAFEMLKLNENFYLATDGPSKGCWLVKMDSVKTDNNIEDDKILVRSNGIPTYTGKDIAYHLWKFGLLGRDFLYTKKDLGTQKEVLYETTSHGNAMDTFMPSDIVMDVIDVRQTYAIDAVRKSLQYLGYTKQSANLIHVNYGHVYLSGKSASDLGFSVDKLSSQIAMSGRKGIGVKIDDFIEMVDKRLLLDHGKFSNSLDVRNAAIKFDLLRYDTFQDIVFDIDYALNLKGFTGPYLEYTHARLFSLLEKAGFVGDIEKHDDLLSRFGGLALDACELDVMKHIYKFPEIVLESALKFAPNMLCVYLYELCQRYNSFYNDSPIINAKTEELKEFRLLLSASVRQVLKNGLYLLGINAVDRM